MPVQITHHGGARGVTGSCHRLQLDADHALLVDCGLFQGEEASGGSDLERHRIDFPVADVRALIVTHVHIDHIGRLPYLLAAGFPGSILCSKPSAQLLPLVIEDALKVGFTRDEALIRRFLKQVDQQIVALDYQQWHSVVETDRWRVQVRLQRAGHILGSAYVEVDVQDRVDQQRQRFIFSGDLGAPYAPLLPAPRSPWKADVLVLESTYGDRRHEDRKHRRERLRAMIDQALADDGTVLIPAFSIGRTQELLYELEGLINQAKTPRWRDLEVIVDSPLAARFTAAYRELKPWWDAEALRRVRAGRHPLNFENLYTVDSHGEHESTVAYLTHTGRPAVVIAASGMASGGRIVNYLKAMLGDARHQVLLVGYQAAGTPGYAIQKYGPRGGWVELDGQRYPIHARVDTISGYSAHADQRDLLNFVKRMRHLPSEVRLVHGDHEARAALREQLLDMARERGHVINIVLP
ncbi:MAG: MBL fold metallo-hydrolase [Candidatus Competibacteraceae bacterium]|nr:MBL fold metallo-hydrolase [Candidatus Competibacteraceae bacterium]